MYDTVYVGYCFDFFFSLTNIWIPVIDFPKQAENCIHKHTLHDESNQKSKNTIQRDCVWQNYRHCLSHPITEALAQCRSRGGEGGDDRINRGFVLSRVRDKSKENFFAEDVNAET